MWGLPQCDGQFRHRGHSITNGRDGGSAALPMRAHTCPASYSPQRHPERSRRIYRAYRCFLMPKQILRLRSGRRGVVILARAGISRNGARPANRWVKTHPTGQRSRHPVKFVSIPSTRVYSKQSVLAKNRWGGPPAMVPTRRHPLYVDTTRCSLEAKPRPKSAGQGVFG